MKTGAKRQVVICPACHTFKVTLGELFFRCCGENHRIKENLASQDSVRSALTQHDFRIDEGLEVQV